MKLKLKTLVKKKENKFSEINIISAYSNPDIQSDKNKFLTILKGGA